MASSTAFRAGRTVLVRAVAQPHLPDAAIPDLDDASALGTRALLDWLRSVCGEEGFGEALDNASPDLFAQVVALCSDAAPTDRAVRRAAASVARYVLRAERRATPFGLFAGVTTATLGSRAAAVWGTEHTAVSRVSAEWLAAIIEQLESHPELLDHLPVVVNNTVQVRGGDLVVPYGPDSRNHDRQRAVEASMTLTAPLRAVLDAAREPVGVRVLADRLAADFPEAGRAQIQRLVQGLIQHGVLLTSLHAPSIEPDALDYLLHQLDAVAAEQIAAVAGTVIQLRALRTDLVLFPSPRGRARNAARMRGMVPGLRRHPLALDLRLDAVVELPDHVAREAERAATVLARVSALPYGTAAWKAYQRRFYETFGIGTMVPLNEVIADSGTGFPDGYPGTSSDGRRSPLSQRDDTLLRLAQAAVLDGRDEVVLTDDVIAAMDLGPKHPRVPPHLEAAFRIQAASTEDLERGRLRLEMASVSRGAGVTTGRFLSVLDPRARERLAAELSDLPAADAGTITAQLSFPPLHPASAHVTRTPQVMPTVVSIGEHHAEHSDVLTPADLAVACDGRRMYLAVPARGQRIEVAGMNALNLREHTPPLARFLIELSRAQCAQVTMFDWGAANAMPYLPRLRYGRTVLAPARWRLDAAELPGRDQQPGEWNIALARWGASRRMPQRVLLAEGDQRLFLDLAQSAHRTLLRQHLHRAGTTVLVEAPEPSAYGWCGGRAHEVVVPLMAVRPPAWPALSSPTVARVLSSQQVQTPGVSSLLLATLYGDLRRQDTLLARHLPDLLERLGEPPWWFIRFRDPHHHLRLRIALPDPEAFAGAARTVGVWADQLRSAGLLADIRYPTSYREMGRWGSGRAWDAAEGVFRADSRAVLAQLAQRQRPGQRALVAAHSIAIATAFLGSTEAAMRWLVAHIPATSPSRVPRPQFTETVRLADPSDDWAALRAAPGGDIAVRAWADRDNALRDYRPHLDGPDCAGVRLDDVLSSLLHVHFVRHLAVDFPEEDACLHLTRAAALAWLSRRTP